MVKRLLLVYYVSHCQCQMALETMGSYILIVGALK